MIGYERDLSVWWWYRSLIVLFDWLSESWPPTTTLNTLRLVKHY